MTQQPTSPPAAPAPGSQLELHLAHFQWRVLQDALAEATAEHWERRAATFEWAARPVRGEYQGAIFDPKHPAYAQATNRDRALAKADRARRHRQLLNIAVACRRKAAMVRETGLDADARALIAQLLADRQPLEQGVA